MTERHTELSKRLVVGHKRDGRSCYRKLPLPVDSKNWTFLAGFCAGGKADEEVAIHGIADRRDSEGRGGRVGGGAAGAQYGISAATYYHWKSKYARAGVPELTLEAAA